MRKIKQEQGSIAVYISVVVLSMLLILFAVFLTSSSKIKAQVETTLAVKQSYEADNKKAGEIYKELVGTGGGEEEEEPQYVQTGLILHYDAIENTENGHSTSTTTWKDLSGNGNDGTIVGGTWTDRSLKFTSSNTSNGVRTNQNFPIDFENTFNIVFKLNKVNNVDVLFGSRTTTSNGFMLFNYNSTNALTLDTKGGGTRISVGNSLTAGTKYDVTITFSGTTANLYVNGELASTKTFTDASLNMPLSIFTASSQSNAIGSIYSVKVYNKALTAAEVQQNYSIDKEKYIDGEPEVIYLQDFNENVNYQMGNTTYTVNNGIITLNSSSGDPMIHMNNVTSFNPNEFRYIDVRYRVIQGSGVMEFFMIESPSDQTYAISQSVVTDGEWHVLTIDLWSNSAVKNRNPITGWRWDWISSNNAIMEVDYIKIRE